MELKPDIRLVIASLHAGGSERVCLRLANAWAAQGLRVELLLVRKSGPYLASLDTRVHVLASNAGRTLRALPWLRRQLNRWPAVPALLLGFDLGVGLGGMKRLGLLRAPLIYREGSLPECNIPPRAHWCYGALIGGVDALIAQSEVALRSLGRLGLTGRPCTVIWNPVNPVTPPAHQTWFAPGSRFLAVGRLTSEKGLSRLVEAFGHLRTFFPGATLDIVGDGPLLRELQQAVNRSNLVNEVRFTGFASNLEQLYARGDCLILASHFEGQPNVLLEALLHGRRVVAAGGPAVAEVLEVLNLRECVIGEGEFSAELVAAITRANSLPGERWCRAAQLLRERTDPERVSAAYLAVCTTASGRTPRSEASS